MSDADLADASEPLTPGTAALHLALGAASQGGAEAADARAFLREQTRLARLQAQDLEEESRLRHWSLRVRHVSDVLKVAFEIALAFIVVSIAVGLAAAIWTASHDDGLVIESFSVPPDMAARGLTGQVIASQLLDKLTRMQNTTDSARPAATYANNWTSDIKVQIPDTGVSAGEVYAFLKQWLGHDTHITGEVYKTSSGGIAVTARVAGQDGTTFKGAETNLDALVQQAAEDVYERTQPYRFAVYALQALGDTARGRVVLRRLIASGSATERAWSYVGMGTIEEHSPVGDEHAAAYDYREAAANLPDFTLAYSNLSGAESVLGHDEASLAALLVSAKLSARSPVPEMSARAAASATPMNEGIIAYALGDAPRALLEFGEAASAPDYSFIAEGARGLVAQTLALAHDAKGARAYWNSVSASLTPDLSPTTLPFEQQSAAFARLAMDLNLADWRALERSAGTAEKLNIKIGGTALTTNSTLVRPALALAKAQLGDLAGADVLIATTPVDCYFCTRVRARIAAIRKDWREADRWFAAATEQAPSVPMAFSEWGASLLARGDVDAAMAKFAQANQVGPHFADPLEMWGEALVAKNRSDLALAKFEEANKYAPHWGRLHLKWGEALLWLGRKEDARTQFATARTLDLTSSETTELDKISHAAGI